MIALHLYAISFGQTVTNGSITGAPAQNSGIGAGNAAGWTVCGFSPDLCDVGFPAYNGGSQVAVSASPDGGTWLGMAAVGAGECAQTTITGLTVGNNYTLCFYGACFGTGALFNQSPSNPDICVGGTCQTFVIPMAANTWTLYTMNFTATAASEVLSCTLGGDDSYVGLDGFTVNIPGATATWTDPSPVCDTDPPVNLDALVTGTAGGVWSGTGGVTGNTFDPSAGTQDVTYTVNPGGCDEVSQTITITVNACVGCDAGWTPTTACSTDPPINLDALITGDPGGTWSGTGVTGNMFDPSGGTQTITYSSPNACDSIAQIVVTTTADASWTPPGAICEADGPINLDLLVTGTAGGTWSGTGVTGNSFDPAGLSGLISITYDVGTVPCDASSTQNITVVTNPDPAWTPPTGLCTGSAVVDLNTTITGTTGGVWSGTGITGSNFDPSVGTQSITYTVGSGTCQQVSTQTITVGAGGNPAWTAFTMCVSDAPVNLNNTITGDPGGTWSGTGVTGNIFDPFFGTQSVTYTVGAIGCEQMSTQTITVVDPQLNATSTDVSCFGLLDGTASVTATGVSGTETYSWNSTPPQNTANATGLGAGTYTVTVMDGTCTATADVTIIEPTEITATMTGINGCNPDLGSAAIIANGGAGSFTYAWNNTAQTTATVTGLDSAMHIVTVTDGNGCTYIDSVLVELYDPPVVTTIADTTILYGECIILPATGASSYSWTPSTDLDCDDCPAPEACNTTATNFCVEGTDANGCKSSDCVLIDIEIICGDVFVPSGFSPNDDGDNDLLCVYSDCMQSMTFTVYNRWGEQVFQTNDLNICWDGTWNGKPLNSAVFVYVLDGYLINGQLVDQKGNISLIR